MLSIAVMAGNSGSGGLIAYYNGIFSGEALPSDVKVFFYGAPQLIAQCDRLSPEVTVVESPGLAIRAMDAIRGKKLPHLFVSDIKERHVDLVFFPTGFWYPGAEQCPNVLACHNVLLLDKVELLRNGISKVSLFWWMMRRQQLISFLHSDGVIFSSRYSQQLGLRRAPSTARNTVVPLGIDDSARVSLAPSKPLRDKVNILYISSILLYKYHPQVVEAIARLRQQTGRDLHLTLVGDGEPKAKKILMRTIQRWNAEGYVHLLGAVPHGEINHRIDDADIFLFASACEAFGLALLEGMGRGSVIACSDRTGLPDILQDAGVYFDPAQPESIATALRRLLDDGELPRVLAARALEYSRGFTWRRSAQMTFAFLHTIADGGKNAAR